VISLIPKRKELVYQKIPALFLAKETGIFY